MFFDRNVPGEGEVILGILGGRPYRWKFAQDAPALHKQRAAIQRWSGLTQTERGEVRVGPEVGRYFAVPVVIDGTLRGTFVVANFPAFEEAEISHVLRVAVLVTGSVPVVAVLLARAAARRVLVPLRVLTLTARSSTDADLSRRMPVRGHDEIAQLAATFNEMLERLEQAFTAQRTFVDDAGHELRTPITIIRGHLELLEENPEDRPRTMALVIGRARPDAAAGQRPAGAGQGRAARLAGPRGR